MADGLDDEDDDDGDEDDNDSAASYMTTGPAQRSTRQ